MPLPPLVSWKTSELCSLLSLQHCGISFCHCCRRFPVVLLDEASQMVEPASLLAIARCVRSFFGC